MKKTIWIALAILLVTAFFLRGISGEDNWICDGGKWVAHGNPSEPMPTSGCGQPIASFEETGHLVKDNPGLKPGVWYLVYEEPGAPALTAELNFTETSVCSFGQQIGKCPDVLLPSSALINLQGEKNGDVITVIKASTGTQI